MPPDETTFEEMPAEERKVMEPKKKFEWIEVKVMEYLNVRSAPTISAPILCLLTINMTVLVEDSGKPWLRVKHSRIPNGGIGYVSSSILPKKAQDK